MKFRFCGDLEAPDWILAQIVWVSRLGADDCRQLALLVIRHLYENSNTDVNGIFDGDGQELRLMHKKYDDMDASQIRACVTGLLFILSNALSYAVNSSELSTELLQIGLNADNTTCIVELYEEHGKALRRYLKSKGLKLPKLDPNDEIQWRVDMVLDTSTINDLKMPVVVLKLPIKNESSLADDSTSISFEMTGEKFNSLHQDLIRIKQMMS